MIRKINKNDSPRVKVINISNGDGGLKTAELLNRFILKYLKNEILKSLRIALPFALKQKILLLQQIVLL